MWEIKIYAKVSFGWQIVITGIDEGQKAEVNTLGCRRNVGVGFNSSFGFIQ